MALSHTCSVLVVELLTQGGSNSAKLALVAAATFNFQEQNWGVGSVVRAEGSASCNFPCLEKAIAGDPALA